MPMKESRPGSQRRILVTGSRGKSSIVRFLHAGLQAAGLQTHARITGVVPRELAPDGIRVISRPAGAHVGEMRWWLRQLPARAQAIVLENSAITAEFQALAGQWLQPDITVIANTLPDHQELWGPTSACAAGVLVQGVPRYGRVVLPASLRNDDYLLALLNRRHCRMMFAEPAGLAGEDYRAINLGLALTTLQFHGLARAPVLQAMRDLPPDRYDFHVANCGGAKVAMAFAVNDITSTRRLFQSLAWSPDETRLIYNHRADRPGRLKSFIQWLSEASWREVLIIGDKPRKSPGSSRYVRVKNRQGLLSLFEPGDRVFGCGNIAGIPLSLAAALKR